MSIRSSTFRSAASARSQSSSSRSAARAVGEVHGDVVGHAEIGVDLPAISSHIA
jgi:hypothetical protein